MSRPERSRLTLRVVVVDDNPDDRALLRRTLAKDYAGVVLHEVVDLGSLERALAAGDFDLTITDYQLHWSDGLTILRTLKARYPDRPVVMFTGTGSEEIAVEAMKSGLDDYVLKSVRHLVRLSASVRTVLARARDRRIARETEETLHSLRKAVDTLPIGVTISDTLGRILYTNPAEARLHGYTVEELLGKQARTLVPSEFWSPLQPDQIRDLKPWKRERVNVRKDGTTFPAQLISDVVRTLSGDPIGVVTTCEDITERKWAEEQLRRNAFYDTLTGLPNRALFMDRLTWALQRARRRPEYVFAVLFLDLDRFKLVNDSFGHGVGDKLLIEVARRLETSLRPSDTIARLGGDEFAILAEEIDSAAEAVQIAQRAQRELAQAFRLGPFEVFASASIGIAMAARPYSEAEELLRDADTAMYRAKAKGKACYVLFDEEMLATARGMLQLETELRRGLERGEFEVYYQPIVSLATGRAVAAEALVRWHHPQRGLLLPDEFIPAAEETGLISPLGEWVLHRACAQTRAWQQAGLDRLRVSVNLSARQFRQDNLVAMIHHALESTLFRPESLALELTESVLMDGHADPVHGVEELKALGVRISIDDFGTGYSSLSYLKRFPVDALKIDQSFVQNVTTDSRDAAIASSVIALARNLKLGVIAEGVETEDQLAFLRRAGCEEIQGYVFSRPLPPDAFERVVRATSSLRE